MHPLTTGKLFVAATLSALLAATLVPDTSVSAATKRTLTFPVVGSVSFSSDFGAPRAGHRHQGNDIIGRKGLPLVAAADGQVRWVISPETGTGLGFAIVDADGYEYWYLHVNNDTPGTDDGTSRGIVAYAPDLYGGNPVVAGQLLGWMGDSGNAESTVPHLHFEIHTPGGPASDPYPSLRAAHHLGAPVTPPALPGEILPYGTFRGGATVAIGDVDPKLPGLEIVTGAGPGGGPNVRIYGADGTLDAQFFAFEKGFRGGIDVATGDVNGDGTQDVVVVSGPGRTTEVRVFTPTGEQLAALTPYGPGFTGGAHVAAADLDGDGHSEFITAPLRGGGPNVRVYDGASNTLAGWFFAYAASYRGGVDVAAYPATETSPSLIVTSPLHGGGPNVRIYNGSDRTLRSWFYAGSTDNRDGLRIALANVDTTTPESEIAVVPEDTAFPTGAIYDTLGNELDTFRFLEPWWEGGYDVAAAPGVIVTTTATVGETRRRTTVRFPFGSLATLAPTP